MNDEDLARHAFAAAFRTGQTGEPPILPDVELLARNARRASRNRHGAYAVGTTALAGVAVAGVVTGPALLGLRNPSPSDIGTAAQAPATTTPSSSTTKVDPVKPIPGTRCATPPAIDWVGVVSGALPAGITATAKDSASCVQASDGSRDVEASFKLSTGDVDLQVNVGTGTIAGKLGTGSGTVPVIPPASKSLDPATLAQLQASKLAAVAAAGSGFGFATSSGSGAGAAASTSSLDPAAVASLQAEKHALASAAANASAAPGATAATTDGGIGSCAVASPDVTTCVSHLTKGSIAIVEVQLMHTGSSPLTVDVMASNGKDDASTPAPAQLPSDATMLALAQAVAAHF